MPADFNCVCCCQLCWLSLGNQCVTGLDENDAPVLPKLLAAMEQRHPIAHFLGPRYSVNVVQTNCVN